MTDQEIRIAIAEACPTIFRHDERIAYWRFDHQKAGQAVDPLTDLNAMHEAEKTLNAVQQTRYASLISEQVKSRHWDHLGFDCLHVIARQRAEAFLHTIGTWEDKTGV